MSLYGALLTGVSGLEAQSQALNVSSSNLANVDTVGYKAATSSFEDILSSATGGSATQAGVRAQTIQNVAAQGLLQTASSPTDLAISGNGFFVTTNSASDTSQNNYYTRAGDFAADSNGHLVNSAGYYLLGYAITTSDGVQATSSSLSLVNVDPASTLPSASSGINITGNLNSGANIYPGVNGAGYALGDITAGNVPATEFTQTQVSVYDSEGNSQPLTLAFAKTGPNVWSYEVSYAGAISNINQGTVAAQAPSLIDAGNITFNSDGTLAGITDENPNDADFNVLESNGKINFSIPWSTTSGLSAQSLQLDLATTQEAAGNSEPIPTQVGGTPAGNLTSISINSSGYVVAQLSNGLSENIYQLPLATFASPDKLSAVSGTAYAESSDSGSATLQLPNTAGAGVIESSQLEASTVDINTEFSTLITTQNAYSAAARIVTTANQMLQALDQIPTQ